MSTKLMNPEEKLERTENQGAKSEPMSVSSQPQKTGVQPKRQDGKQDIRVMTVEEVSDLLARLQDILSLWEGSDNKIIGNYVMTAFPAPEGMKVEKVMTADKKKAFAVNGVPVVNVEQS